MIFKWIPHSIKCARAHKQRNGDISLIVESGIITEFKEGIQILHKKSAKEVEPRASHLTFLDLSFLISHEGEELSELWGPFLKFCKHFTNVTHNFRQTLEFQKWKCQLNNE